MCWPCDDWLPERRCSCPRLSARRTAALGWTLACHTEADAVFVGFVQAGLVICGYVQARKLMTTICSSGCQTLAKGGRRESKRIHRMRTHKSWSCSKIESKHVNDNNANRNQRMQSMVNTWCCASIRQRDPDATPGCVDMLCASGCFAVTERPQARYVECDHA